MQVGPGVCGGSGTANVWPKYSNSPKQRGENLFQMFQNQHFLGLLLSFGTGNMSKKPRWSHAFGGEPQSCGQDKGPGLLFQSCQVSESSVIAIAVTARPSSLAASVPLSLYSPGARAWLCKVADLSNPTHWV